LESIEGAGEFVGDDGARFNGSRSGMLFPDASEFESGVFDDLGLDFFDVFLIERGGLAVFEDHKVEVFLKDHDIGKMQWKEQTRHTWSFSPRPTSTSSDDEVTPPLFALASLNTTTPLFSK
jgi:hypothetical protein